MNSNVGTDGGMAGMSGMNHSSSAFAKPPQRVFGRKGRRSGKADPQTYAAIDTILPVALPLNLAYPVEVEPPQGKGQPWTVRSDSQNRMLRDSYSMDGATGAILAKGTFYDRPIVDRITSMGISAHEGHLFGWLNQAIGVFTASTSLQTPARSRAKARVARCCPDTRAWMSALSTTFTLAKSRSSALAQISRMLWTGFITWPAMA
jgi:hypothetical protein